MNSRFEWRPRAVPGADSAVRLKLLRGPAALAALHDPVLLTQWEALLAANRDAEAFQGPGFIRAWYAAYAGEWEPVLAWAYGDAGAPKGLWFLAYQARSGTLAHAGAQQAEYQRWLVPPGGDAAFVSAAWQALCAELPVRELRIRYLPTQDALQALLADQWLHQRVRWRTVPRPLMRLDAEDIRKSAAKKSNKSRVNRLKRLGKLEFRQVTDAQELARVLPTLMAFYDFRQGAVNDSCPFIEDNRKRAFHEALFAAGAPTCHLTVTMLDDQPIAAFWGAVVGTSLQLGMLIHSPELAEHSPGKLHVQSLAEFLLSTGIDTLDLTPGGDAWKERFANAHDEVWDLTLFSSPMRASRRDWAIEARTQAKALLADLSLEPAQVRSLLGKIKRVNPTSLIRQVSRRISEHREYRIYRLDAAQAAGRAMDSRVHESAIGDLLAFEPTEAWQRRQDFLSAALSRIEAGDRPFTIVMDGKLVHSGWLVPRQSVSRMTEVSQTLHLPDHSATLFDFYTHPSYRGRGLYGANINHMLARAFADPSLAYAYISVLADNGASRKAIERAGFEYIGSFRWTRRFGRVQKSADACFIGAKKTDADATN
ncbi:MAG: GNAT family N-acetyltransferase [Rubrivivax sp.]|nr:MAG: GNAT family N-acetyltransferase [Rubrivivax sp.]